MEDPAAGARLHGLSSASSPLLVVTPTLGRSPWLAETVASVAALPIPVVHILVTPEPDRLAALFPGVRVAGDPGGGMYAAINAGVAASDAWSALTYINDDDLLLPAVASLVAEASAEGARVIYGGVRLIDSQGRRQGSIPISPAPSLNRALYAQRLEPVYQHGTLISRAAWSAVGPFDPSYRLCGDSEWLARACVRDVPFIRATGREVAAFRLRANQLTKSRTEMLAERRRVDESLGLLSGVGSAAKVLAKLLFRSANLPKYAERIQRHGLKSFDEVLASVE